MQGDEDYSDDPLNALESVTPVLTVSPIWAGWSDGREGEMGEMGEMGGKTLRPSARCPTGFNRSGARWVGHHGQARDPFRGSKD